MNFSFFAVSVIRILIGLVLIYLGLRTYFYKKAAIIENLAARNYPMTRFIPIISALLSVITGGFLAVGFLTQIAAIISAYAFLNFGMIDFGETKPLGQSWLFYFVMTVLSLALVFLGAGAFAVDLPL